MKTGVYIIRNKINDKCYIGSAATSFKIRRNSHRHHLRKGTHHNSYLQNAWNKHGADAFEFAILLFCAPEACIDHEQIFIDIYQPEYNICQTAGSRLGVKHSEATKKKMCGKNNSMYGKPITDAHRKKLCSAQCGRKFTIEHKNNLARAIGKLTENNVLMIREALTNGVTIRTLYEKYNVTKSCIMSIKHRRTWRHI